MVINIIGDPDFIFAAQLSINIQEFVLMWDKLLEEIEIIDE